MDDVIFSCFCSDTSPICPMENISGEIPRYLHVTGFNYLTMAHFSLHAVEQKNAINWCHGGDSSNPMSGNYQNLGEKHKKLQCTGAGVSEALEVWVGKAFQRRKGKACALFGLNEDPCPTPLLRLHWVKISVPVCQYKCGIALVTEVPIFADSEKDVFLLLCAILASIPCFLVYIATAASRAYISNEASS